MSILRQIQQDLADRLLADPAFATIPVLSRKKGETLNEMQGRIDKLKLSVSILILSASVQRPNIPGPYFSDIAIQVAICENRLNNDQDDAETIAEYTAAILHHYKPQNISEVVVCAEPTIVEVPPERTADQHKRWIAVNFRTAGGLSYFLPTAATPTIENVEDEITLATATAGAAIFFTLDDKHPSPRNGTLYTEPFATPAPGTKIKTRAWLAGYLTSEQATLIT